MQEGHSSLPFFPKAGDETHVKGAPPYTWKEDILTTRNVEPWPR